jgi:putative phosphoribosyl transferase
LKFQDRVHAANILADKLKNTIKSTMVDKEEDVIVLGIPRGGVVIADVVATKLSAEFDIVIGRKLRAPANKELAIGAVMEDGTAYFNDYLVKALRIPPEYLEKEKLDQMNEIKRRAAVYRKMIDYKIVNKVVILVDDGIATGATVIATARWIRKQEPKFLMIAVPVAPSQTVDILKHEAGAVETVASPFDFNAVGEFYENFDPVTDEHVIEIMKNRNLL